MREKISNILFLLFLFILSVVVDVKKEPSVEVDTPQPELRWQPTPNQIADYDLNIPKEGKVQNLLNMKYATVRQDKNAPYGYSLASTKIVFANVEPSTYNKLYFANGYLNGFVPYNTGNLWNVLSSVQARLKYQLDEVGYKNKKEVWQTSKQSYLRLRGDCEDHAILLADWLIGLGYDARVALGTVKMPGSAIGGHAWVILYKDNKEYLLEATKKSKWNQLPLASKFPNYFPEYIFNRNNFWTNRGSKLTTKYSGEQWKKSGKFIPFNPYYKDI